MFYQLTKTKLGLSTKQAKFIIVVGAWLQQFRVETSWSH
jgi:hypothetical protein